MSQRILGLDIGAASVKATILETSFRSFQLVGFAERSVRGGDERDEREARREVLRQMVASGEAKAETVMCALPGDKVMTRILSLPFTDPKRIDSVLGFELENYLPFDVDEIVYDYQVLDRSDDSTTLFAAAVKRETMADFLADLKEVGLDPKVVSLDALSYLNLFEHLRETGPGPVAMVDIGARTTEICVVNGGKVELVRTVLTAGDAVTSALAHDFEVDGPSAEQLKKQRGILPSPRTSLGPEDARIAATCAAGLAPLLRDLRQTFQAFRARSLQGGVAKVLLCGGSSRLLGIHDYLEDQLGVPVEPLSIGNLEFNKLPDPDAGEAVIPKSLALSLRATGGRSHADLNFRQGPFAYQGDFQFLRDKMVYIVLLAVMLLGVAAFKTFTRYRVLDERRETQLAELGEFSVEVLGKEKDDFDAVLRLLQDVPEEEDLQVFPEITATQVFYDVTTAMQEVNNTSKADLASAGMTGPPDAVTGGEPLPLRGVPVEEPDGPRRAVVAPRPPPGPSQEPPPAGLEQRAERLRQLREARGIGSTPAVSTTRGPDLERLRAERLQRLRSGTSEPASGAPAARVAAPVVPTSRGVNPAFGNLRAERDAVRDAAAAAAPEVARPAVGGAPLGPDGPDGEAAEAEPAPDPMRSDSFVIELENIRIEETAAFLKGEANSIEALELFSQKLDAHRCFRDCVTSDTDKVTFPRHQGWLSFRIEMTIDCREVKKSAAKPKEETNG